MEQQPIKTISISGVEVKVSPMAIPEKLEIDINQKQPSSIVGKFDELKAFEASFYPVEMPFLGYAHVLNYLLKFNKGQEGEINDGYYPAPEGLTFTVNTLTRFKLNGKFTEWGNIAPMGVNSETEREFKQVAVVTFSEPKEERNQNFVGGYQPDDTVDTSNPPRQEREEKPDLEESIKAFNKFMEELPEETLNEIMKQVNATGIEGPTVEEYFASLSPQYVARLQQEITTLQEQNRKLTEDYNKLGIKYDKELERWQERDAEQSARISELEKDKYRLKLIISGKTFSDQK